MPGKIVYHNPMAQAQGIPFAKSDRDAERDAFYNSTRWKKLRAAFMAKVENRLCRRCQAVGETALTAIVHHIRERLDYPELAYSMSNLEGVCKACHNRIHKTGANRRRGDQR